MSEAVSLAPSPRPPAHLSPHPPGRLPWSTHAPRQWAAPGSLWRISAGSGTSRLPLLQQARWRDSGPLSRLMFLGGPRGSVFSAMYTLSPLLPGLGQVTQYQLQCGGHEHRGKSFPQRSRVRGTGAGGRAVRAGACLKGRDAYQPGPKDNGGLYHWCGAFPARRTHRQQWAGVHQI